MKKVLQILIFLAFSIKAFCQMDTEHWFAPMFDSYINLNQDYDNTLNGDFLYLSTDSADDFEVTVYAGEAELEKVSIRKGAPKYITLPKNTITTTDPSDVFLSAKKGLHLVGSRKFFANLRILRGAHAEIINSKGFAGLGTDFIAVMAPLSRVPIKGILNQNTQISILATENNTSIRVNGYDPNILFLNNTQSPELNIRLNKGESYMAVVPYRPSDTISGIDDPEANHLGLVGASIHSDKPINVTNGNFNGNYINNYSGSDILMDQAVPVNRLGREYIIAKGNGKLDVPGGGGLDIERVIVMATKDGTKITVNDSPVTYTINKGKYEILYASRFYKDQGNGVYNMYVKSTEDVYVYQLLAGTSDPALQFASGGMNMVPAINCLLPNQIVELPEVNQIGTKDDFETNINIITKSGAQVTMNGEILNGLYGPHPVSGTSDWVMFSKNNVKGNISIYSTKAVTAGLAGGNKAVGFGGFFGGFSSVPQIIKTGDCITGQKLQVDDGYDSYEWYLNGTLITSGPKSFFINPELYGAGNYYCIISKADCGTFRTDVFIYNRCPQFTTKVLATGNCKITGIPVAFSYDPQKPIDWASVNIIQRPEEGRAYFDPLSKTIIFDPENTDLKTVTFKYYFQAIGSFPDSEQVTVTVNIQQIVLQTVEIKECLDFDGNADYNLKSNFTAVNTDPYKTYSYYSDSALAILIPDTQLEHYRTKPGSAVYVVVTNSYDCNNLKKPAQILLNTYELPSVIGIDVKGATSATINVSKGRPPYLYFVKKNGDPAYLPEPSEYSSSNVLPLKEGKGTYRVYVKSADDCNPVTQVFTAIVMANVITPNDDGKNDEIDMSILNSKLNPTFHIFTRAGKLIFEGSSVANNFTWNGKQNGVRLSTGTYWYLLKWQDFEGAEPDILTGWILLKNRNSD